MGKLALVFPGQGAQYVGMGKDIYENYDKAKEVFEKGQKALGMDINTLMFEGPEESLSLTENTQPAILIHSIAILEVLREKADIEPKAFAGLSLGEYSALVASGSFDFEDAVKFVRKRGQIMQEAVPEGTGSMAAILGLDRDILDEVIRECSVYGIIQAANYNCPGQIVISGELKPLEKAVELCKEKGAKRAVILNVSGPFHSSLLDGAGEKLKSELEVVQLGAVTYPVVSNVTGDYAKQEDIKELLVRQVSSSVMWEDSIGRLIDDGFDTFVEIGPGKTLSSFIKKISKKKNAKVSISNIDKAEDMEKFLSQE